MNKSDIKIEILGLRIENSYKLPYYYHSNRYFYIVYGIELCDELAATRYPTDY